MQNINLSTLYNDILSRVEKYDLEILKLQEAFNQFKSGAGMTRNLTPKYRKFYETPQIAERWKQTDALVSALLLHLKSLERAAFPELKTETTTVCSYFRQHFKGYVHASYYSKQLNLMTFINKVKVNQTVGDAFTTLSLTLYYTHLSRIYQEIVTLQGDRQKTKSKEPRGKDTLPAKEKLIEELRTFLKIIEFRAITEPELDYSQLISMINQLLTVERAQERNLATRRKNAKNKTSADTTTDLPESIEH
jgi:hypothetical protein